MIRHLHTFLALPAAALRRGLVAGLRMARLVVLATFLGLGLVGTAFAAVSIPSTGYLMYTGITMPIQASVTIQADMGANDKARLTLVGPQDAMSAGTQHPLAVTLINQGGNPLVGSIITLTLPPGFALTVPGAVNTPNADGTTTLTINVASLNVRQHIVLNGTLTVPADAVEGVYNIGARLDANGTTIVQGQANVVVQQQCALGTIEFRKKGSQGNLSTATVYHAGVLDRSGNPINYDTIYVQVTDPDRNLDPTVAETITIDLASTLPNSSGSDQETVALTETGLSSGVFLGSIAASGPPPLVGDALLTLDHNSKITAIYTDPCGGTQGTNRAVSSVALVDPYGLIFDTKTGLPLANAGVRIVYLGPLNMSQQMAESSVGTDATVFADDGITPSSALLTTQADGRYRYPYVPPGTYRLEVTPPAGYRGPSQETLTNIQALPNAPFAMELGSRGEVFRVNPGPALHIDYPLDPLASDLYLTKAAGKSRVAIGDFLTYKITIENPSLTTAVNTVVASDRLPMGIRYRSGSLKIDGVAAADPTISADGLTLTIPVGALAASAISTVEYVAEVGALAGVGTATNTVTATGAIAGGGTAGSNVATATTTVTQDLFATHGIITGQVWIDGNDNALIDDGEEGLGGVRIYMEDGRSVITDPKGKYHFDGIVPGIHVVQVDLADLDSRYEPATLPNTRFADRAISQFVDVKAGGLWRANFRMLDKAPPSTPVTLTQRLYRKGDVTWVELEASRGLDVAVDNWSIVYQPPTDWAIAGDQAMLDGNKIAPEDTLLGNVWKLAALNPTTLPDGSTNALWKLEGGKDRHVVRFPLIRGGEAGMKYSTAYVRFTSAGTAHGHTAITKLPILEDVLQMHETIRPIKITVHPNFETFDAAIDLEDVDALTAVMPKLEGIRGLKIHAIGHTDNVRINPRARITYADNQALSEARAQAVGEALGSLLGLPEGAVTWEGRGETQPIADNTTQEGRAQNRRVELIATGYQIVDLDQEPETLIDEAGLDGNGLHAVLRPYFPEMGTDLGAQDRDALLALADRVRGMDYLNIRVEGHTDNQPILPKYKMEIPDNRVLSQNRAQSVAQALQDLLGLPDSAVSWEGFGENFPLSTNKTEEGRAENRRVEVWISRKVDRANTVILASNQTVSTVAQGSWDVAQTQAATPTVMVVEPSVAGLASPKQGDVLPGAVTAIRGYLDSRLKPRLTVDGVEISADRIGMTSADRKTGLTMYSYIGINLGKAGEHTLTFEGTDTFGNARFKQEAHVRVAGDVARIVVSDPGDNVADGRTPVRVKVQMFDASGIEIHGATEVDVSALGLIPMGAADAKQEALAQVDPTQKVGRPQLSRDGYLYFRPLNRTGRYEVTVRYNTAESMGHLFAKAQPRDWILVALGEGTVGYNTVAGNLQPVADETLSDKLYHRGKVALFAKGQIKGDYLMTVSFDSNKHNDPNFDGFLQQIDPSQYYTVYGDATVQNIENTGRLYVKIEKDTFYAMYGNFQTGLNQADLARYNRTFTGLKSEYQGENLDYTLFATQTPQTYVRDELPGDGTSGMYYLSRSPLLVNSEQVTIETRDRFHSERILSSRPLSRFLDYSIDYTTGALYFKEPVPSTDGQFNPVVIVVEYEANNPYNTFTTFGGRVAARPVEGVEVGGTYVQENGLGYADRMSGIDTTVKLGEAWQIKGELAQTQTRTNSTRRAGSAEVQYDDGAVKGRVYTRQVDGNFGLGQTQGSELGTRKSGADGSVQLAPGQTVNAELYRQEQLGNGAQRDVASVQGQLAGEHTDLRGGLRHVTDLDGSGNSIQTNQVTAGISHRATDKLTLVADRDQGLGSANDADFPTRTALGLDYLLGDATTLTARQEWTQAGGSGTEASRIGIRTTPWSGGQLSSDVQRTFADGGERMVAAAGLKQTWTLTETIALDAGLDHSRTLGTKAASPQAPAAAVYGASENFTAYSLGGAYTPEGLRINARVELRRASSSDKWVGMLGAVGDASDALSLFGTAQGLRENRSADLSQFFDVAIGLAYRPAADGWMFFDRFDVKTSKIVSAATQEQNLRLINNLSANWQASTDLQLSLQYGAKWIWDTLQGTRYKGFLDLMGGQAAYEFRPEWDVSVFGRRLHSYSLGQTRDNLGMSIGYNVVENAYLAIGYNFSGFYDRDFSALDFTLQGPFLAIRFKLDQTDVGKAADEVAGGVR